MMSRTLLVVLLVAQSVLFHAQNDTLVLNEPSDFRALKRRPQPKVMVITALSEDIPFHKLARAAQQWGELAEIVFHGNAFEEYPSVLTTVPCRTIRFTEQDWVDFEDVVDAALASRYTKHLHFVIDEFDGLDQRVREPSTVDSLTVVTTGWEECKKAGEPCYATSFLHVTVQADGARLKQIPLLLHHREDPATAHTLEEVAIESAPCKKYVSVAPPINGVEVPIQAYTVNAETGGLVNTPSGSVVQIPQNAFVDASGQRIGGNVTLTYREFRTSADLAISGIPMSGVEADSSQSWYFESGGMLEINAFQGQQELWLADGKRIDIAFATTSENPNMELFRFEDAANRWIPTGPAPMQEAMQPDAVVSPAYYAYMNALLQQLPGAPDTAGLAYRFSSFDYIHQSHVLDYRDVTRSNPKLTSLRNHIRLVSVRKNKEFGTHFRVVSAYTLAKRNPEMRAFQQLYFCVGHDISARELRRQFNYKNNPINDVRIYENGDELKLVLKGDSSFQVLEATVMKYVEVDGRKKLKPAEAPMARYTKLLRQRSKVFQRKAKSTKVFYMKPPLPSDERRLQAWQKTRTKMTEQERAMTPEEWFVYVDSTNARLARQSNLRIERANSMTRLLNIPTLGIWNCDVKQRYPQNEVVRATYVVNGKECEAPKEVYVLCPRIKAGLNHTDAMANGYSCKKLFIPDPKQVQMVAYFSDGSIGIYSSEVMKSGEKLNGSHTFQLDLYAKGTLDEKALQELLR